MITELIAFLLFKSIAPHLYSSLNVFSPYSKERNYEIIKELFLKSPKFTFVRVKLEARRDDYIIFQVKTDYHDKNDIQVHFKNNMISFGAKPAEYRFLANLIYESDLGFTALGGIPLSKNKKEAIYAELVDDGKYTYTTYDTYGSIIDFSDVGFKGVSSHRSKTISKEHIGFGKQKWEIWYSDGLCQYVEVYAESKRYYELLDLYYNGRAVVNSQQE